MTKSEIVAGIFLFLFLVMSGYGWAQTEDEKIGKIRSKIMTQDVPEARKKMEGYLGKNIPIEVDFGSFPETEKIYEDLSFTYIPLLPKAFEEMAKDQVQVRYYAKHLDKIGIVYDGTRENSGVEFTKEKRVLRIFFRTFDPPFSFQRMVTRHLFKHHAGERKAELLSVDPQKLSKKERLAYLETLAEADERRVLNRSEASIPILKLLEFKKEKKLVQAAQAWLLAMVARDGLGYLSEEAEEAVAKWVEDGFASFSAEAKISLLKKLNQGRSKFLPMGRLALNELMQGKENQVKDFILDPTEKTPESTIMYGSEAWFAETCFQERGCLDILLDRGIKTMSPEHLHLVAKSLLGLSKINKTEVLLTIMEEVEADEARWEAVARGLLAQLRDTRNSYRREFEPEVTDYLWAQWIKNGRRSTVAFLLLIEHDPEKFKALWEYDKPEKRKYFNRKRLQELLAYDPSFLGPMISQHFAYVKGSDLVQGLESPLDKFVEEHSGRKAYQVRQLLKSLIGKLEERKALNELKALRSYIDRKAILKPSLRLQLKDPLERVEKAIEKVEANEKES